MLGWTALFFALTAAAVYVAWRSQRASGALGSSYFHAGLVIAATCLISNALVYFGPRPHMQFYPVMDAIVGAGFILNWYRTRRGHHLVLACLFLTQAGTHVWYFSLTESTHAIRLAYDTALNAAYVAQLLTVAIPSLSLLYRSRPVRMAPCR